MNASRIKVTVRQDEALTLWSSRFLASTRSRNPWWYTSVASIRSWMPRTKTVKNEKSQKEILRNTSPNIAASIQFSNDDNHSYQVCAMHNKTASADAMPTRAEWSQVKAWSGLQCESRDGGSRIPINRNKINISRGGTNESYKKHKAHDCDHTLRPF